MSFATAVSERFFHLPPTFSRRATFQVPAIFLRADKRSLPLESRKAIAAARISPPSSSAPPWLLNFAIAASSDILSTAETAVCSEAPPPDSVSWEDDAAETWALFPKVGSANATHINDIEPG